jgi:regulatory protein
MVYAGRLLARRDYAVAELELRLLRKWAGSDRIAERVAGLIADLQADGSVSDSRFAESFTRSRRNRYHGPVKIRAELRQRAVPEAIVEEILRPMEHEWVPLAASWLSQRCNGPLDFEARARYYRRLMSRGFSHQQAMEALASAPTPGSSPE